MQQLNLSALFDDGKQVVTDEGTITLRRHEIGTLRVAGERIVACDPLVAHDTEAFTTEVPPGECAVTLSVATYDDADQRVAGAMVRFADGAPVRWSLALQPGEDASELEADEVFGYGVDSGVGCFMDERAAALLVEKYEADGDFQETIIAEMDKTYVDTWSWANMTLDETTGANIVLFSSGMGDGLYASYFGYDADDRLVCLITDFSLLSEEEMNA